MAPLANEGKCLDERLRKVGGELLELVRSPQDRLLTVLVICPMGIGAAANLWAAIAAEWHAAPNLIAFLTGVVNGLAAAAGCLLGGWMADRVGRWMAFFGSGLMMAGVALLMAGAPKTQTIFGFGLLLYAVSQGFAYSAFSALVLHAVAKSATKYSILISLGNIPVSYMTAFDGFAHDRWGSGGMLLV
jgi:MFS transporter, PAT family, beta-lactamase induction signal transducer AmpG